MDTEEKRCPSRCGCEEKLLTDIAGYRRAEHRDLPYLERLARPATRELFGDVHLERLYEIACLSVVQYNKEGRIVSGMFLCNYPNVPSVPQDDWLTWLKTLYRIPAATERNTMFIHWLVWNKSYSGHFLKDLLSALFDITTYCQHVILVIPPRVTSDMFEREMTRVLAKGARNIDAVQSLYLSDRSRFRRKLKIRRIVEEDNDDVIPIIDGETKRLKELYGEYYISEMIRYPDGCRQLIIGEKETDDSAAGVICLNSTIDIELLNENFELTAYHGLRKPHENDEELNDVAESTSELLQSIFSQMPHEYTATRSSRSLNNDLFHERRATEGTEVTRNFEQTGSNESGKNASEGLETIVSYSVPTKREVSFQQDIKIDDSKDSKQTREVQIKIPDCTESINSRTATRSSKSGEFHRLHSDQIAKSSADDPVDDLPSLSSDIDVRFQPKMRATVLADAMLELSRKRNSLPAVEDDETLQSRLLHDFLPRPTYHGEKNAFILEIFAMCKGMRPHWSLDFLEAAFDSFPDLDYCVILLPFTRPSYQFLQHFARVPPKYNKDYPMILYVLHRAVFFGEIKCRRSEIRDRNAVQELLASIPTKHKVLADFDLAIDPSQLDLDCFVFECNDTMLGLAILCTEKEIDFVKSRYHVEDYVSMQSIHQDDYGRLLHFVLTPIFSSYHRFFFREIARLSGLTVIFYRLHHEDESALTRKRPLASCLNDMTPVNPRGQAGYKFPVRSEKIDNRENDPKDMFSLFMISPRLAMMPSTVVDLRIVIVGASDCGIALVEHLVLRSEYRYTNLTLISPHGLPFDNERSHAETALLPFRGKFCSEYRRCITVRSWINNVYGTMTAINRKKKYVTVKNQGNLAYDYLVLTCGLQYQRPTFQETTKTQKQEEQVNVEKDLELPWNCLTINDDTEASICLKKILWLTNDLKKERAILFYGRNIDCFCALRGLIEFGVNPLWITLIEPSLNSDETHDDVFCCDCEVDEAMTRVILQSGIQVLSGWSMIDWTLTRDAKGQIMIESVAIDKKGEMKTLVCDALLNFHEKTINLDTFLAFCRAGLIFNGLLIIDPECRTNDPFIFAAGTVTKYSRKFRADSSQHVYFSSVEVGERSAEILRKVIDIQRSNEETSQLREKEKPLTPPIFRRPIVIACILPGNYHYLHVHKPGKKTSCRTTIDRKSGEVFVTGSCTSKIGYFRIRLNSYDAVDAITCVSKKAFQVQDIIALYGKHESMLNELKFRFKNSFISDFYAYFREPWAAAIFHDRFECLRAENRATLMSQASTHHDYLVDDCVSALIKSKWQEISERDRRYIESKYAGSIYHRELENNLIRFLEFHENDLPMYCTPSKQRQMYTDVEESPLYFE